MDPEPQVIKESSCPSLSRLSQLTYQIGNPPDGNIHFRIIGNSGNGIYSSEWVSLNRILDLLNDQQEPFIWSALCPLFQGRSVNTACFLMAALLAEGLVQSSKEQPRRYELGDTTAFIAKVTDRKNLKKGVQKKSAPEVPADPAEATA